MSENSIPQLLEGAEVPCMLLPMEGYNLLVPTVSVAEMSSVKPLAEKADSPEWILGYYEWRNTAVPVVSLEGLNGKAVEALNPSGRIAVLNSTGLDDELPFIAIHTQGIPRMARVGDKDITENADAEKREFDLMAVKVGLEELVIPDIDGIQKAYLER